MGLVEFDADHLSHSPNNFASVSDAVSSDQRKLPGNFDRAAYLQRCSSLGPITNETGNRVPVKFNGCGCHSLQPASQLECEQSAARSARPIGQSAGAANQSANHPAYGPRKRRTLQSVPDRLNRPVGMRLLSVRGTWGASRTLLIEHGAVGGVLAQTGLVPTGRIPRTNLDVKLSALF
jgi:hypothetical protein